MLVNIKEEQQFETPQYWDILSEEDKKGYRKLQKDLQDLIKESGRSKFCKIFPQIVSILQKYITKNDSNDYQRSLVCGIVWMDESLALNTRQLITTIQKCKSSINSGFQSIGYQTFPMEPNSAVKLMQVFPFLKNNMSMTRQWTLRKKINKEIIENSSESENSPIIISNQKETIDIMNNFQTDSTFSFSRIQSIDDFTTIEFFNSVAEFQFEF